MKNSVILVGWNKCSLCCIKLFRYYASKYCEKKRNSSKFASHFLLTSITEEYEELTDVIRILSLVELVLMAKSGPFLFGCQILWWFKMPGTFYCANKEDADPTYDLLSFCSEIANCILQEWIR